MAKAAPARQIASSSIDAVAADVGRRIRAARQERGMSLAQLGGKELSRSFLSLVELGRSRISLKALSIVAERLELPISYFLEDAPGSIDGAGELAVDYAEVSLAQGNAPEALRLLEETNISDIHRPRALLVRGHALLALGRAHDALPVLQEGLALVERKGDLYLRVQFLHKLGVAYYNQHNYAEALVTFSAAEDAATRVDADPSLRGKIAVCVGHVLYVQGKAEQAVAKYAEARTHFGTVGDLYSLGCVYSGLSQAYKQRGDLTGALRYSKLSLGAFEANQDVRLAASELNNLAVRYQELKDYDRALETAKEAVSRAQMIRAVDIEAFAHSTLASIQLRLAHYEEAEAEAEAAQRLAPDTEEKARVDAWLVLAELSERSGNHERADQLYRQALDTLRQSGEHTAYADAALAYSLALRSRGDTDSALEFALESAQAKKYRAS